MLHFDVTIPATVMQRSEIPEGLMNYPVFYLIISGYNLATCFGQTAGPSSG